MLKIVRSELFTSTTSRKLLTEQNKKKTVTECNRSLPYFLLQISVADPGFPRGGGANSLTYNFPKISQKLHGIERIWTPGGDASLAPPLDPPLNLKDPLHTKKIILTCLR